MLLKEGDKEACTHRWRSHHEAGGQARSRHGEPGDGKGIVANGLESGCELGNSASLGSAGGAGRSGAAVPYTRSLRPAKVLRSGSGLLAVSVLSLTRRPSLSRRSAASHPERRCGARLHPAGAGSPAERFRSGFATRRGRRASRRAPA